MAGRPSTVTLKCPHCGLRAPMRTYDTKVYRDLIRRYRTCSLCGLHVRTAELVVPIREYNLAADR